MRCLFSVAEPSERRIAGSVAGILVFLGGVALLIFVFRLAYDMFAVPPTAALGSSPGATLDLNLAIEKLVSVVIKVVMLLVMAILGGAVANRGIRMYGEATSRFTIRSKAKTEAE